MALPEPKPWVAAIAPYVPGRAKVAGLNRVAKLSSNESPLGPSPRAVQAMAEAAKTMHRYPDGASTELREAIGRFHGLDPDRIICGAGSDEVLGMIGVAYAGPGDEIVYVRHGFMVYPIVARTVGAHPIVAPDRDYTADVDNILASVTDKTKIVFLANPNNPTGTFIPQREVVRLREGLPEGVVLVLDEAYAEYIDREDYGGSFALADEHANIIVTRTFSKAYGLAAARVGWGYGAAELITTLNKIRHPFNLTHSGQQAAIAALADQEWVAKAKAHNDEWLPWLSAEIEKLGLRAVPSVANFVLVEFPEDGLTAELANERLAAAGYLVRWLPKQGLVNGLRMTVGTEEENRGLIEALARALEKSAA